MKLNDKLLTQMRAATRNLMGKGPQAATEAIQQALRGAAPAQGTAEPPAMRDINPPPAGAARLDEAPPQAAVPPAGVRMDAQMDNFVADLLGKLGVQNPLNQFAAGAEPDTAAKGQFIDGSYSNAAGTRGYKLYVPTCYHGQTMPLVVMLHGCTQNPDDFATGTQMNAVAEEKQFLVLYPAQTAQANQSKCWNWFSALDQQRGQGEPSIIAGMTREVMARYPVDPAEVYVAGLSAGGAMAVIMGTLYPDLYAKVGVHSGLPFASAHDLPSALAAMQNGSGPKGRARAATRAREGIPIIVFHGDQDSTVHPRNGDELLAQGLSQATVAEVTVQRGRVPNGHAYTQTTHSQHDGAPWAEHWVIHGAGHAWSGGSGRGSYTDARGPDASREMMRFFRTSGIQSA